jgi:hypothetical protein
VADSWLASSDWRLMPGGPRVPWAAFLSPGCQNPCRSYEARYEVSWIWTTKFERQPSKFTKGERRREPGLRQLGQYPPKGWWVWIGVDRFWSLEVSKLFRHSTIALDESFVSGFRVPENCVVPLPLPTIRPESSSTRPSGGRSGSRGNVSTGRHCAAGGNRLYRPARRGGTRARIATLSPRRAFARAVGTNLTKRAGEAVHRGCERPRANGRVSRRGNRAHQHRGTIHGARAFGVGRRSRSAGVSAADRNRPA